MSKEFERGLLIGSSSIDNLQLALRKTLGEWARLLPYLDNLSSSNELELVASISYILRKDIELTPPLRASLARDFVVSSKRLLVSIQELLLSSLGEKHGEEEGQ